MGIFQTMEDHEFQQMRTALSWAELPDEAWPLLKDVFRVRRFEAKVKAGAEFVVTQPVFQVDLLEAFLKRIEQHRIPVIAGIWPLASFRNAEFLANELRVPVPPAYMTRMSEAQSAESAQGEGTLLAELSRPSQAPRGRW